MSKVNNINSVISVLSRMSIQNIKRTDFYKGIPKGFRKSSMTKEMLLDAIRLVDRGEDPVLIPEPKEPKTPRISKTSSVSSSPSGNISETLKSMPLYQELCKMKLSEIKESDHFVRASHEFRGLKKKKDLVEAICRYNIMREGDDEIIESAKSIVVAGGDLIRSLNQGDMDSPAVKLFDQTGIQVASVNTVPVAGAWLVLTQNKISVDIINRWKTVKFMAVDSSSSTRALHAYRYRLPIMVAEGDGDLIIDYKPPADDVEFWLEDVTHAMAEQITTDDYRPEFDSDIAEIIGKVHMKIDISPERKYGLGQWGMIFTVESIIPMERIMQKDIADLLRDILSHVTAEKTFEHYGKIYVSLVPDVGEYVPQWDIEKLDYHYEY